MAERKNEAQWMENQALAHPAKLKTRELRQKAHRIHSHSGALFQCLVSKRVLERVIIY